MKRIKMGVAIVCCIGVSYFMISYGIFLYKKTSIDAQIQEQVQPVADVVSYKESINEQKEQNRSGVMPQDESVVIQTMSCVSCKKHPVVSQDLQSDVIVTNDEQDEPVAQVFADDRPDFIVSSDKSVHKKSKKSYSYSFITMKISDDYVIDQEIQDALDVLIGNDVDAFVKLILQSNNNIVSKEACRSCGMYAFFNGIKNHKPLTSDDVRMLQKMLANLYRFIGKMQKLNQDVQIISDEQYEALQSLHKTQAVKNDMKLQARKAATSAALKKLQNIKYKN